MRSLCGDLWLSETLVGGRCPHLPHYRKTRRVRTSAAHRTVGQAHLGLDIPYNVDAYTGCAHHHVGSVTLYSWHIISITRLQAEPQEPK